MNFDWQTDWGTLILENSFFLVLDAKQIFYVNQRALWCIFSLFYWLVIRLRLLNPDLCYYSQSVILAVKTMNFISISHDVISIKTIIWNQWENVCEIKRKIRFQLESISMQSTITENVSLVQCWIFERISDQLQCPKSTYVVIQSRKF